MQNQITLSTHLKQEIIEKSEAIDWNLPPLTQNELNEIREQYNYIGPSYKQFELLKIIDDEISQLVLQNEENETARALFHKVYKELLLKHYIEDCPHLYSNIAYELFHLSRNESYLNKDIISNIPYCLELLVLKHRIKGSSLAKDPPYQNCRIRSISNSFKKLNQRFSLKYSIENGDLFVPEEEFIKIGKHISNLMKQHGGIEFLRYMFNFLNEKNKYNEKYQRYFTPLSTSTTNDKIDPSIPWGYLFNLALKSPKRLPFDTTEAAPGFFQIIHTATQLVSLLDVEPYNIYESQFTQGMSTFQLVSNISLLDSNFKIPQLRNSDTLKLIKGILSWTKSCSKVPEKEYSKLIYFLGLLVPKLATGAIINRSDLKYSINRLNEKEYDSLLSFYSHNNLANKDFNSPVDYHNADAVFKPLIKIDEKRYYVPLQSFSSLAVIECSLSYFRKHDKHIDDKVGIPLENFFKSQLKKRNIPFKSGNYTNSEGEEGEVDLAVETNNMILFIEVKKKALTRKARSGHGDILLLDLQKSLLNSQFQALRHEKSIRLDKKIKLDTGDEIELRGRRVEKMTLTLFDYGALHDRSVVKQLLNLYLFHRFSHPSSKMQASYKELNEKCSKFARMYSELTTILGEPENIYFFDSCFVSASQFLILLDNISNAEELQKSLFNTKFVVMNSFDWYWEHHHMSKLKEK